LQYLECKGMPVVGTWSLPISAAYHPAPGDDQAAIKQIMYGAVVTGPPEDSRSRHVWFSGQEVEPLQDGIAYY
jgi:hypothetical protein